MVDAKGAVAKAAGALEKAAFFLRNLNGLKRYLAAFGAGVCAALAMAPFYMLPLLVLGFSVLIVLLDAAGAAQKPKRVAFLVGWAFGFGYFLAGVYWMAFSFFVQAEQFAWMAPFAVTGMPAFLAVFAGGASVLTVILWRPGPLRVFVFAALWAAFEYLRGHILTGLPWNLAGQALAGGAIGAQTAAWYGAYGLSLVAVLLSAAPAAYLAQGARIRLVLAGPVATVIGAGVLFLIGVLRLAAPEPVSDGKNLLRIVQPNIPQREKIDFNYWGRNFKRQLELSKGAAPDGVRVFVIWPENAAPLLDESRSALDLLGEALPYNAVLIAGAVRREENDKGVMRFFNSIMVINETAEGRRPVSYYDKHHLVPFGEYLPFYNLFNAIGLAQLTPYGDSGFTKGAGPNVLEAGGARFAPLVCYEAIFPRALYPRGERPEWLLTVTNDAWFGDTSGPRQHLDQARLRSIETGLPMARSANTGISAVIDGKGRLLHRMPLYQEGRIEALLPPALPPTLYERVGDLFFLALVGVIGICGRFANDRIARF